MAKTVPVREFRSHLADLLVVPVHECGALEETAEILSDDDTLAAIRRGLDDLAAGDEVPLDQVREELANRREA